MREIIILIGAPGAGKGTQAELLSKKLGLFYFETSKALEESWAKANKNDFINVKGKKFFLLNEKKLFDSGNLCTPLFVSFIVERKIRKIAKKKVGIVFAGSPRTLDEAKKLMPILIKLYGIKNIFVFEIKISDKEAIWRNTKRRICSKCRHPVPFTPETRNLKRCPVCGGKLITRNIDTVSTMKIRLKEYKQRTYPILSYFKEIKIKPRQINGEQSIENVNRDILKVVKQSQ